jgi:hypothetical protein
VVGDCTTNLEKVLSFLASSDKSRPTDGKTANGFKSLVLFKKFYQITMRLSVGRF